MSYVHTDAAGNLEQRRSLERGLRKPPRGLGATAICLIKNLLRGLRHRHFSLAYDLDHSSEAAFARREELDKVLLDSLRPYLAGCGIAVGIGAVYLGFTLGAEVGLFSVLIGLLIGAAFFAVYRRIAKHRIPSRFAHPLAACVSLAGYALLVFGLVSDDHPSGELRYMALSLTVVVAGALYLTARWLLSVTAILFASWTAAILIIGSPVSWYRHFAAIVFISLCTMIVYATRKRAILRMIETQYENERQNAQLAEALERAHRSEAELQVERHLANQIVDSMGQGLVLLNRHGQIEYANPAAEAIFGESMEMLSGRTVGNLLQESSVDEVARRWTHGETPDDAETAFEVEIDRKDGTTASILVTVAARENGGPILSFTDLTPRKQIEERLERLAHYDALTGLANRLYFIKRLREIATDRRREHSTAAILFIDLDRFKQINDTMGHAVGDKVLIEASRRIQRCIRTHDIAARFGGDEFVVLLTDIESEDAALGIANNIARSLETPFLLPESIEVISSSIGVSISPTHEIDPDIFIREADVAMYEAKFDRDRSSVVYRPELRTSYQVVA